MPHLCKFYPGICLTTEEKSRKNLSQGKKNLSQVKKNLSQSTLYILPKTPTHYKTLTKTHITKPTHTHTQTHTHLHTLQNNTKPLQYKLKQNTYRKSNNTQFLILLIHRYSTPFLSGPSLHFTALHCKHSNENLISVKSGEILDTFGNISLTRRPLFHRVSQLLCFLI